MALNRCPSATSKTCTNFFTEAPDRVSFLGGGLVLAAAFIQGLSVLVGAAGTA